MDANYWSRLAGQRVARRRLLIATGGASAGAAFLAACGGNDGDSKQQSKLLATPVDTSKQAKRGGVLKHYAISDANSFDPTTAGSAADTVRVIAYTPLVRPKTGYLQQPDNEVVPDLAESWEFSPDKLTLTLKMRQGVKWHNKPPVNNRLLDVQDILFSFDRASRLGSSRNDIFNSANPAAPIVSVSAPDSSTIAIKLTKPLFYTLNLLSSNSSGRVNIIPKETDTTFDIRRDMIGTGPYVLKKYETSIGYTFTRNPDFYDDQGGFVDEVELPIIAEYSSALAQFRVGNIYSYATVTAEDILPTKRDLPQLNLYQYDDVPSPSITTGYGWQPDGKSVFLDERVRQAYSRSIDRDLWLDTVYNTAAFRNEGLPVDTKWNSHSTTEESGWLDPRGKDFGENSKYFQVDIADAKRLLAAAGYENGIDIVSVLPSSQPYGPDYPRQVQITEGMVREAGFRIQTKTVDYNTEFLPKVRQGQGKYEGWAHRTFQPGLGGDVITRYNSNYNSKVPQNFLGFSVQGKSDGSGDPYLESQIEKGLAEFDSAKRAVIAKDLQRYLAKAMYDTKWPGAASTFKLVWPVIRNYQVFRIGGGNRGPRPEFFYWWLDDQQPPLKKT